MDRKKEQLIELWQTCFGDAEAFTTLFFDRVYRPENTLSDEADGRIVSALHLIPYTWAYGGSELPATYVAGVATSPDARGTGRAGRLMSRALSVMRQRGDCLSVLIPAEPGLFDYYRRWGYAETVCYRKYALCLETAAGTFAGIGFPGENPESGKKNGGPAGEAPVGGGHPDRSVGDDAPSEMLRVDCPFVTAAPEFPVSALFAAFDRLQRLRPAGIRHDGPGFETILRDLFLGGGELLLALGAEKNIRAMAFIYPDGDGIRLIRDLPADSPASARWLTERIFRHYPAGTVFMREPSAVGGLPFGMVRVIDAERLLALYARSHPEVTCGIDLHDPGIPENSGRYRLAGGGCRRVGESPDGCVFRPMACGELPAFLFGGTAMHLALMLD